MYQQPKYNQHLRGLIRNSGLTQSQFAEKIGIHYATISLIINNVNKSLKHRQKIAEFFGKPLTTIFRRRR